jgi:hypothetical protein
MHWRIDRARARRGEVAGYVGIFGYGRSVSTAAAYYAHRLAFRDPSNRRR